MFYVHHRAAGNGADWEVLYVAAAECVIYVIHMFAYGESNTSWMHVTIHAAEKT